jgi:hypothetical protein
MDQLLTGMIVMGYGAGSLFFFRFWKGTRDRLFLLFGLSFLILAVQRILLAVNDVVSESIPILFLIRLLAFVLILVAILDKNVRAKK